MGEIPYPTPHLTSSRVLETAYPLGVRSFYVAVGGRR